MSQHRPSLIKSSKTVVSLPSEPYKQRNFRKAKWKKYTRITNGLARNLPSPDTICVDEAFQDFCNTIIHAAKKSIPRGRRKNYRPCWDAGCEVLYQAFLRAPQGEGSNTAASALLAGVDKRWRKRWSEAVNAIDFTHSSWLAGNAITDLTARTRQSCRPCPISANSIASQLVENDTYKTNGREFTRLVLKEVSELWRIPTPADKCISGDFSPEEFARSLQMLKPGKAPGPNTICPELIIHAGASLKSWLNSFLFSSMHQLKLPKIWRRALVVAIPNPMNPPGEAKSYRSISLLRVPFNIMERLIYARIEPIVDPLLPQEQAGF